MEFVEIIREDELVNGTSKVISVKGKDIALFKIDNRITELGNSCLHKGRPLTKGKIEKKYDGFYVTCPWHGWEYNISNGKALLDIMNNNLFLMFLLLILIENSKEDRFSELNLTYK